MGKLLMICFLVGTILTGKQGDVRDQQSAAIPVSLVQLISDPDKMEGKRVTVVGFFEMTREGDRLYLSQEDYRHVILTNCILVERSEAMGRDRDKLNLRYVKISGRFHVYNHGNVRPNIGIAQVQTYEMWSDPNHPLGEKIKALTKD